MQDIENAVGQHDRLGKRGNALLQFGAGADFLFEVGHGVLEGECGNPCIVLSLGLNRRYFESDFSL